ncbi:MAG: hypothetical protein PHQ96_05560 [Candidatus Omnitrophica bacterium]|nr:hypothetical protein [Candidatus Omnitrophota bacterium]
MHKIPVAAFLCAFLLILPFIPTYAQNLEYSQTTANTHTTFSWHIEKQGNDTELNVIRENGQIRYVSKNNAHLATTHWFYKNQAANTEFTAERRGNSIFVEGTNNGKSFKSSIDIDSAPWYQPMSFSLANLVCSQSDSVAFWTINPENLKAFKMAANKIKKEIISRIAGQEIPAQKVKVRLAGFRSGFWHAYYWFRIKDGLFIRYEGVDGPPGTPLTEINLKTLPE